MWLRKVGCAVVHGTIKRLELHSLSVTGVQTRFEDSWFPRAGRTLDEGEGPCQHEAKVLLIRTVSCERIRQACVYDPTHLLSTFKDGAFIVK